MTHFLIIISSMIVGGLIATRLAKEANNIDKILHYEVELDNGNICHECGQAYPCPTLVEIRS
jgi:predicted aldo/keto reductase-like oxidoreductase